jgi:hypothetical protein
MKRFVVACVVLVGLTGTCQAQSPRVRVYAPYYNGYGLQPGLSVDRNGYSVDYFGGSKHYRYGYVPPSRVPRGRRYNAGNGIGLAPAPWMFYYPGMELSPYNINSPIWD